MQSAKESVKNFMAKSGHHDTTVHETVAPAVHHETIKPHVHENVITATDREVHQDHHHHTVQPVHDREVLPEKHEHNMAAVQHREVDHRDHEHTKHKLAEVGSQFKDERVVHDTKHTQSAAPAVTGEHVHHHIHETIQPVVHKEVVQPNVVHTTVPIHEVHHKAATHHNTTELPPVSMSDFKTKGGVLGGREERYDGFEGEPKNIGGVLGGHSHEHTHGEHQHGHNGNGLTGTTRDGDRHGHNGTGLTGTTRDGDRHGNVPGATGTHTTGAHNTTGTHETAIDPATGKKPSLIKKLNPFADADGDGKKGLMD